MAEDPVDPATDVGSTGPAVFACQDELLELLDLLIDVIFCMKGLDGRYVAVNSAFVRRTGRKSKREVIGFRATELFGPALAQRYEEQDSVVLAEGKTLRDELELIRREDGSLGWYLTNKIPVAAQQDRSSITGLVSISRDLRTPSADDTAVRSLSRVLDHVRSNLATTIRVADLATIAECSTSQLERRMRKTFGLSAKQYVLRARVDKAAELLINTELSVADIAIETGFYDQADLTHRFARLTNETPAQFRSQQGTDL